MLSVVAAGQIGDYDAAWRNYRSRRNQFLFLLLGLLPVLTFVGYVTRSLHALWPFTSIVGASWLVLLIIARSRLSEWPCPRCGKPFFTRAWFSFSDPFVRRCFHCGLPKYSGS